jgi:hypothetical protein
VVFSTGCPPASKLLREAKVMSPQQGDSPKSPVKKRGDFCGPAPDGGRQSHLPESKLKSTQKFFDFPAADSPYVWIFGIGVSEIVPDEISAWTQDAPDFRGNPGAHLRVEHRGEECKLKDQIEFAGRERELVRTSFHKTDVRIHPAGANQAWLEQINPEAIGGFRPKIVQSPQLAPGAATHVEDSQSLEGI